MRTKLRRVGNSQAVLIPSVFLDICGGIGAEIEMRLEGEQIVIQPVKTLRSGWFTGYTENDDVDGWEGIVETSYENEDWQW